jgi:UDP-N-acetyl-D-glucosamine dehydrogenase
MATSIGTPFGCGRSPAARGVPENTNRTVNVALVNELKNLYHRMGIDIWEMSGKLSQQPKPSRSASKHFIGAGLGGHCIPLTRFT